MTISFHGNGLLFGGRSHRSGKQPRSGSGSDSDPTPRPTQMSRTDSQSTIKPMRRDDSQATIKPSQSRHRRTSDSYMRVEEESSSPSSSRTSSWPLAVAAAAAASTGIHQVVAYFSADEQHSSDEEQYSEFERRQSKHFKMPQAHTDSTPKISRTHPDYSKEMKKAGKLPLPKFHNLDPEDRPVPHHLWNTDEEQLPARFHKSKAVLPPVPERTPTGVLEDDGPLIPAGTIRQRRSRTH